MTPGPVRSTSAQWIGYRWRGAVRGHPTARHGAPSVWPAPGPGAGCGGGSHDRASTQVSEYLLNRDRCFGHIVRVHRSIVSMHAGVIIREVV
ncbi:hypothetical protein Franean1_3674 [Parafrankia sp. EAN1pec]|nr:hypothetical protein Franean1_3674 [Frankia sp. EAN1pec]